MVHSGADLFRKMKLLSTLLIRGCWGGGRLEGGKWQGGLVIIVLFLDLTLSAGITPTVGLP